MRSNNIVRGAILALGIVVVAAPATQAQGITDMLPFPHLAIGGVGSSLGLGGDVAVGLGKYFVVRGAKTVGSVGINQSIQDQPYNIFAKANNVSVMLDFHPFAGGFYLSAGQVTNHSTFALTGQPSASGTYTFNGQSYQADSVGIVSGAIKFPEKPLFFGFGWDHTFGNSWPTSLTSRVGVLHQDKLQLAVAASGPYGQASNPQHASFQAAMDAETAKQQQFMDRSIVRNLPVVELGLRMRLF